MRVLVAGASGVLGRRIVRQLVARNHTVVGLARSATAEATVRSLGGEPRRADLFDADAVAQAAKGCDVVIRAATAIPTKVRTGPQDWAVNDRIRREGTRSLVAAAARVGARAFLQESVVWAVGTLDGRPFDEDAPLRPRSWPTRKSLGSYESCNRDGKGFTDRGLCAGARG